MQTNILNKKKKTLIMSLAKTKQNNIIHFKTKVGQKTGPAEWWSKKRNRLRSQVKKRPPNFNQ